MGKVLVTGTSVRSDILDVLIENGHEFEVLERAEALSDEQLAASFEGVDAYLCGGDERTAAKIYEKSPSLKIIAFLGVGYAAFINERDATRAGIAITNTPGTLTESVAEATVGLALVLNRKLFEASTSIQEGFAFNVKTSDLCEKKVGIFGMGSIGTRVAKIFSNGFGCEILYHNRRELPSETYDFDAKYLSKDQLFTQSDIVIVMVTGTPENYGIVSEKELNLVSSGTLLVNTARPEIVDGQALASALKAERLGGAAIDGYYGDDNFDISEDEFGLLSMLNRNVVVTPHLGSLTHNARDKMGRMAISSIVDFLEKGSADNIVNSGYLEKSRWRSQ